MKGCGNGRSCYMTMHTAPHQCTSSIMYTPPGLSKRGKRISNDAW